MVGVGQTFPAAKVLWLLPQGAAQRAGIRVGDRVGSTWERMYYCTIVLRPTLLRTGNGVVNNVLIIVIFRSRSGTMSICVI